VAGFDGVQILANYLYLIFSSLMRRPNLREDEYEEPGDRFPILFEVLEAVLNEVVQPVGVKISPMHESGAFAANEETLPITSMSSGG